MTEKWISVKDRLPECDVNILFYTDCEQIRLGYRNHYPKYFECGNYHDYYDSFEYDDVTHWMPLPEPPK